MNNYDSIESVDPYRFNELATRFLDDNYQQHYAYAQAIAQRQHARNELVAIYDSDELLGLACVRIRQLPLIGGGVAYISGGPLTRKNCDDTTGLVRALNALRDEYVDRRKLTLRILAPLGSPTWNRKANEAFEDNGFRIITHARRYQTFVLDLQSSLEDLRDHCSKYWRRNLRRAERRKFVIESSSSSVLMPTICALYERLLKRKGITTYLDVSFFAQLQPQLEEHERFQTTVVKFEGKPVAGLIVSMLGDFCIPVIIATDIIGMRNYATYLLQWHSISVAQEYGFHYYDLGAYDRENCEGVFNFKKGLRGIELNAPGPYEYSGSGLKPLLTSCSESIYRRFAHR